MRMQHALEVGHLAVDLVEPGGVDVPELGVLGVEVEVVGRGSSSSGVRQREHVGAQVDLQAEVVDAAARSGRTPRASPRRARRGRRPVVDAGDVGEGDVLQEAGDRDRVVALGQRVLGVRQDARRGPSASAAWSTYGGPGGSRPRTPASCASSRRRPLHCLGVRRRRRRRRGRPSGTAAGRSTCSPRCSVSGRPSRRRGRGRRCRGRRRSRWPRGSAARRRCRSVGRSRRRRRRRRGVRRAWRVRGSRRRPRPRRAARRPRSGCAGVSAASMPVSAGGGTAVARRSDASQVLDRHVLVLGPDAQLRRDPGRDHRRPAARAPPATSTTWSPRRTARGGTLADGVRPVRAHETDL